MKFLKYIPTLLVFLATVLAIGALLLASYDAVQEFNNKDIHRTIYVSGKVLRNTHEQSLIERRDARFYRITSSGGVVNDIINFEKYNHVSYVYLSIYQYLVREGDVVVYSCQDMRLYELSVLFLQCELFSIIEEEE